VKKRRGENYYIFVQFYGERFDSMGIADGNSPCVWSHNDSGKNESQDQLLLESLAMIVPSKAATMITTISAATPIFITSR
jgi:hypothetical protein